MVSLLFMSRRYGGLVATSRRMNKSETIRALILEAAAQLKKGK